MINEERVRSVLDEVADELESCGVPKDIVALVRSGDIVVCAACGGLSAFAPEDVADARGVASVGACSGFEYQCGHCGAHNVKRDAPILAEVYTHVPPEAWDEERD